LKDLSAIDELGHPGHIHVQMQTRKIEDSLYRFAVTGSIGNLMRNRGCRAWTWCGGGQFSNFPDLRECDKGVALPVGAILDMLNRCGPARFASPEQSPCWDATTLGRSN
jgi:hypothetical protein